MWRCRFDLIISFVILYVLFVRNPRVLVAPRRHLPVPRVCVVSPKERDPSFTAPPTQTCLEI
jgi:hypothetical protein